MAMSSYYNPVGSMHAGPPTVFPSDRVYHHRSPTVHEVDHAGAAALKFDMAAAASSCPGAGYASTHGGFDLHAGGYQGQLQQQPAAAAAASLAGYGTFDGGKAAAAAALGPYPGGFNPYAGQPPPSAYPAPYLNDKFESACAGVGGSDVISQYGGRHFNTAAMMAAAVHATIGQHPGVAAGPSLPIYPWMRSMGTGNYRIF